MKPAIEMKRRWDGVYVSGPSPAPLAVKRPNKGLEALKTAGWLGVIAVCLGFSFACAPFLLVLLIFGGFCFLFD